MKRKEGFLDLDYYYEELKEQQNLTDLDLNSQGIISSSTYRDEQYWLMINGEKYYYKTTNSPFNELICYEIAKLLDMDAVEYDLAVYNNQVGVISKSYKKEGYVYKPGYEILEHYYFNHRDIVEAMGLIKVDWEKTHTGPQYLHMNNLEIIWQALEYKYHGRKSFSITDCFGKIIDQFIFIILTGQYDKGAQNWEIEENETNVNVVPLYDNEFSFETEYHISSTLENFENEIKHHGSSMSTNFNDCLKPLSDVLKTFLNISSSEYINLFIEKYNILTEEKFYEILNTVEDKIGIAIFDVIKKNLIKNFKINRSRIQLVLDELNIDSKMGR